MLKLYEEPRDDLFIEETIIKKYYVYQSFYRKYPNKIKVFSNFT